MSYSGSYVRLFSRSGYRTLLCIPLTRVVDGGETQPDFVMDAKKLWGFLVRNVSTKTNLPPFTFPGNLAQLARSSKSADLRTVLAPYTDKSSVGPSRTVTFCEIERRLNSDTSYGGLPTLHSAIWVDDDVEIVRVLLELGANPDLPDEKKGLRPAQIACLRGRTKCMEALIQCGVELTFDAPDPDHPASNSRHRTPLSLATRYRRAEIQKMLEEVDRKGPPSVVDMCKQSLWFAVRSRARRRKVTKDDLIKTLDGKTAAEWAAKNGNSKVATELQVAASSAP